MTISADELDNPERDLALATRSSKPPAEASELRLQVETLGAALAKYERRILRATAADPAPAFNHCRDCHRRGFARAVQYIREGGDL